MVPWLLNVHSCGSEWLIVKRYLNEGSGNQMEYFESPGELLIMLTKYNELI